MAVCGSFFLILVLLQDCGLELALAMSGPMTAWQMKVDTSRDGTIFTDHLLLSFDARSLLECVTECVQVDWSVTLSYWKNASSPWSSCRCHSQGTDVLTQQMQAPGARLYNLFSSSMAETTVAETTQAETTVAETTVVTTQEETTVAAGSGPAADFVMYSENAKMGWNPARQRCESAGMKLATLDQAANDYLISLMSHSWYQNYGKIEFWVGLYDSNPASTSSASNGYRWLADCSSLASSSWTGWGSGEPQNTADSFCVALTKDTGEWRSFKCDSLFQFLCETRKPVCNNANLGYDSATQTHRSSCFSFRFDHSSHPDDKGSTSPSTTCPSP